MCARIECESVRGPIRSSTSSPAAHRARGLRLALAAVVTVTVAQSTQAALVSGHYMGEIDEDSGLGLIGQTMYVQYTYDDAVAPHTTFSSGQSSYSDFLSSLRVTIGDHIWTWVPGEYDHFSLSDDNTLVFSIGVEDRVHLNASTFVGQDLVPEPVEDASYDLAVYLSDNMPFGEPNGLDVEETLPDSAPNPDLFDDTPGVLTNTMVFSFTAGDVEFGGEFYRISTSDVMNVPEPATAALMAAALTGWAGMRGRRA